MILWRISNYATLDGIGGTLQSARWHTIGRPIVYAADHPASAMLEMLVNVDAALLPDTFQLLKIEVPDSVRAERADPPAGWQNDVSVSRAIGDDWLKRATSVLLQVPSAVMPEVFNTLINPLHPQASSLRIEAVLSATTDQRLKKT